MINSSMKKTKNIIIYSLIFLICACSTGSAHRWSLYDLLTNDTIGQNKQSTLINFNPDKDMILIPPLENKEFFESINDLSICRRSDVRKHIYLYLTTGRKFLRSAIARSKKYLPIIEGIFEKDKDIPRDLSLLPLLESAFNPYAVSRSKAVGMWQFLKRTSQSLGLKTNRWVDERRHIEKSTGAAIAHLKSLHKIFNSWPLAIAAYNGGAGHVKKAMRKSGAKNLVELQKSGKLKKETAKFVPRYAALAVIFKNQWLFNIKDEIIDVPVIKTENFVLNYPVNIRNVSKISGVSLKTIRMYNPELKKNITPPYTHKYSLRLPGNALEKLKKNKSKLYRVRFKKLKTHIVKEGECLSKIAARYKTKMNKILALNNLKNPNFLRAGQKLYIPI